MANRFAVSNVLILFPKMNWNLWICPEYKANYILSPVNAKENYMHIFKHPWDYWQFKYNGIKQHLHNSKRKMKGQKKKKKKRSTTSRLSNHQRTSQVFIYVCSDIYLIMHQLSFIMMQTQLKGSKNWNWK